MRNPRRGERVNAAKAEVQYKLILTLSMFARHFVHYKAQGIRNNMWFAGGIKMIFFSMLTCTTGSQGGPNKIPAANFLWLHFLNNRSSIQSIFLNQWFHSYILHSLRLKQKSRAASIQISHGDFGDIMAIFRLAQYFVNPLQGKGRK